MPALVGDFVPPTVAVDCNDPFLPPSAAGAAMEGAGYGKSSDESSEGTIGSGRWLTWLGRRCDRIEVDKLRLAECAGGVASPLPTSLSLP